MLLLAAELPVATAVRAMAVGVERCMAAMANLLSVVDARHSDVPALKKATMMSSRVGEESRIDEL